MKAALGCLGQAVAQHPGVRPCACQDGAETSSEALFSCRGPSQWMLQRSELLALMWKVSQRLQGNAPVTLWESPGVAAGAAMDEFVAPG